MVGVCTSDNARVYSISASKIRKRIFLFQIDQAVLFYFISCSMCVLCLSYIWFGLARGYDSEVS